MRIRLFAAMISVFFLCAVATAQDYTIRVTFNTNLRDTYSLEGNVVETAPAGATLHVVGRFGRWLTINRNGNEVWMASWVSHTRVESATQTQTATQVASNIDNCCFVDRQCNNDQEWIDGYWAFQNNQCAAPSTSQDQTPSQPAGNETGPIDNCCYVDRQCNNDQEWMDGYWAFQNGQCAAPSTSQDQTSPQPAGNETGSTDNCCFAGWQCNSDQEWVNGFYAYQSDQCHASPESWTPAAHVESCCQLGWSCTIEADRWIGRHVIENGWQCGAPIQVPVGNMILEGSETFIAQVTAALELLKSKAPHWYAYVVRGAPKIRGGPWGPGTFAIAGAFNIAPPHAEESTITLAGTILHETCHVHRDRDGSGRVTHVYDTVEGFSIEENVCEVIRVGALKEVDPSRPPNPYLEAALNHFFSNGGQFDFDGAANGQREKAIHLLSTMN